MGTENFRKITIITGHYGSGKSTLAANIALKIAETSAAHSTAADTSAIVTVVDMDIVNPYYRTSDLKAIFEKKGVKLLSPMYAGTNLDTPILDYDISGIYEDGGYLVIDMGGDDAGAYALGKFAEFIKEHLEETDILCTVNFCRGLTDSPAEALENLREIEAACRLKITGLANTTNLSYETNKEVILRGVEKTKELSRISGIPVKLTAVTRLSACEELIKSGIDGEKIFPVDILIKNIWE
ncbi:MAG: cobalamin biosynthesis protein CobQ [Oscillospiraceae bacterium]|nr:cobalamin biosynthesis protein CobQ [Oscillospiraceae bacterium]